MKLSIAWIFDHIDARWQDVDLTHLMATFNQVVAEIEHFYPVSFNLDSFYLAQQKTLTSQTLFIPELAKEIKINTRKNPTDLIAPGATDLTFMVKKVGADFAWATLQDFGVDKDGLMPPFEASKEDLQGGWRKKFEHEDVMLEVDNKSITHRPDMWGHRGFAREIAAMLKLPFLPKDKFLRSHPVKRFATQSSADASTPFVIDNQAPELCKVFNGLYFKSIENKASDIFITSRLVKVGGRPINALVDLTNYVTQDWAEPVHAYDAEKIADKKVIIRLARPQEKLLLLDGNALELTKDDLVIADGKKPMCLAGVKGGFDDSVSAQTKSIFFEAANFDAGSIRRAAMRHKTRTDSSARFEKTLDPNQALEAVLRFLKLTEQTGVKAEYADAIMAVGPEVQPSSIEISHEFLERKLGITISKEEVIALLERLEFGVKVTTTPSLGYVVTVPTLRASKDIKIKEDIVEEVARSYGFGNIKLELPRIYRIPFDLTPISRRRKIREYLANTMAMMEQQNYSFFDEELLTALGLEEQKTVSLLNPVSENFRRLVTSLVPGLLKNIKENMVHHDTLNFFECARIWSVDKNDVAEKKAVTGIFFEKRRMVDFYQAKHYINNLLVMLGFDASKIVWEKMTKVGQAWYKPYQSATIKYDNKVIGVAGNINPTFASKLDVLPESDAFIFELDGEFLLHAPAKVKRFVPFSRFQETFFDLSLLVPLSLTTDVIEKKFSVLSSLITQVELLDFFEREEWTDVRSLTFRVWLSHAEKTLEKEEVDAVRQQAINVVQNIGGQLRS